MTSNTFDLEQICSDLVIVAKEAGAAIRDARPSLQSNGFVSKKNTADIVTETDQKVEALVRQRLAQQYPAFCFVGEETHVEGEGVTDAPTFIVDPIDGTSNFVHGLPEVCVSIGLTVAKQPVVGVVYAPFLEQLWSATRGGGSFVQCFSGERQRLPLVQKPCDGLQSACIGIEWGSDREGPNFELNLDVFAKLARTTASGGFFVNSMRCIGSAAISICRTAAGQQEAFWECGCWPWDVAAAWCILEEAGGLMVDVHPGNWTPFIDNRRYLAIRPASSGQAQFVEEFWAVVEAGRSTYGPQ